MTGSIARASVVAALMWAVVGCTAPAPAPAPAPPAVKDSGPGSTTLPPLGVIGSRPTSSGGQALEVTLNEVRVRGQLMTVIWTTKNTSPSGSLQIAGFFADGRSAPQEPGKPPSTDDSGSSDGVYVVDSANGKRYLPARDQDGNCVCTVNGNSNYINAGQTSAFQATFKAPPDNITSVDVNIPHVGVFIGVAISR